MPGLGKKILSTILIAVIAYALNKPNISALLTKRCIVLPRGQGFDDSNNINEIVQTCSNKEIIFPNPYTYMIKTPLRWSNLQDVSIKIEGRFEFSDDIAAWTNSCLPVDFQNQCTSWIISGSNYSVDGAGTGIIDARGQTWYSYAAGASNVKGRPITMTITNTTNARIDNISIKQPAFWASLVTDSNNVLLKNISVTAKNTDPKALTSTGPNGSKWVQNTDGSNTYRSSNIHFKDWTYIGGDDLIGVKGNSSHITINNITGYGGNGIAIGSIGQYPERVDNVNNILIEDVKLFPSEDTSLSSAVYFKSWVGVPTGIPPNGGGGGTGKVSDIYATNVHVEAATLPVYIESCLTYLDEELDPSICDTSTLSYENIEFINFTGTTNGNYIDKTGVTLPALPGQKANNEILSLLCSKSGPCSNIKVQNYNIQPPQNRNPKYVCKNVNNLQGIECS